MLWDRGWLVVAVGVLVTLPATTRDSMNLSASRQAESGLQWVGQTGGGTAIIRAIGEDVIAASGATVQMLKLASGGRISRCGEAFVGGAIVQLDVSQRWIAVATDMGEVSRWSRDADCALAMQSHVRVADDVTALELLPDDDILVGTTFGMMRLSAGQSGELAIVWDESVLGRVRAIQSNDEDVVVSIEHPGSIPGELVWLRGDAAGGSGLARVASVETTSAIESLSGELATLVGLSRQAVVSEIGIEDGEIRVRDLLFVRACSTPQSLFMALSSGVIVCGNDGAVIVAAGDDGTMAETARLKSHGFGTDGVVVGAFVIIANAMHTFGQKENITFAEERAFWGVDVFRAQSTELDRWVSGDEHSWTAQAISMEGGVAFVAAGGSGVQVLRVEEGGNLKEIASIGALGEITDVFVESNVLYMLNSTKVSVSVYDVSEATEARLLAELVLPMGDATAIEGVGDRLVVGGGSSAVLLGANQAGQLSVLEEFELRRGEVSDVEYLGRGRLAVGVDYLSGAGEVQLVELDESGFGAVVGKLVTTQAVRAMDGLTDLLVLGLAGNVVEFVTWNADGNLRSLGRITLEVDILGVEWRDPYLIAAGVQGVAIVEFDPARVGAPIIIEYVRMSGNALDPRRIDAMITDSNAYVPLADLGLQLFSHSMSFRPTVTSMPTPMMTSEATATPIETFEPTPGAVASATIALAGTPTATPTGEPTPTDPWAEPTSRPSGTPSQPAATTATATVRPAASQTLPPDVGSATASTPPTQGTPTSGSMSTVVFPARSVVYAPLVLRGRSVRR